MGSDRARRWGPSVTVGALLAGACGDDFVAGTETEGATGSSTGDSSGEPPTPTSTTPTSTTPTTTAPTSDTGATDTGDSETSPPTTGATDTSTTAATITTTDTGTGTTADTTGTTGTTTDTDTDTDTTTGDGLTGRSVSQTVNSGTTATSANFRMVFTLGQPTQNQGVYQSANFRLQGGLIGANGDPP